MDARAQSCSGSLPDAGPDPEWAAYVAWLDGEVAAGRDPDRGREPEAWEAGDWKSCDPAVLPIPPAMPVPPAACRGLRAAVRSG
jgi:hypothetical protein